ncbi:hypothetical protein AJ79_01581 [Helicocarpus griseus UAMH5409]|uniref:Major facilitator superfamily (MFS) profile domain-containing protein n=1 Tax=Helicocarpus griseus UAMH5409 TaxID=1447875 RepID=A0A2B7Y731_9EURO|nr:hypothetical protein AJ79_01581 [Helicocarpus griseus UAMH5409]
MSSQTDAVFQPKKKPSSDRSSGTSEDGSQKNAVLGPIVRPFDADKLSNAVQGDSAAYATVDDVRFYKPIDEYEGIHRWDPHFEWEEKEEKRLVRKLDVRICAFCCFMFFALQLDRGNISQALSDNMLDDLGLDTNDYNTGMTIFYVSFLCAELPSQLISKKIGPDKWIPIQMVCWSLIASFQAFLSGRASFFVCRSLLGIFEGGFIPDNVLYLSYFYKSNELSQRLSFFWTAYQLTSIIAAFLAYGILRMRGILGMGGWRWLFALEGTLTGLIGIFAFFYLPASPTQTVGFLRGKDGWFNEREEKIMVNRVLRDDPSKGDMHNRQAVSIKLLLESFWDYDMWMIYILGITWHITNTPATNYITLQLRSLGFSVFETNLLTIPAYVLFIITCLFMSWLSEKINQRFLLGVINQTWSLAMVIALVLISPDESPWARWVINTLLIGAPYIHPIIVAITSRNAGSVRTRTVASAMYNMCVQASSIIASNVYREDDKPLYRRGNKALIGVACLNIVLFIATKLYYVQRNKSRERIWNAMTTEEKETYLATTTDKGNKRLDFRFAH